MQQTWTPYFQNQLDTILAELQTYVEMESPTSDKAAVDTLGQYIHQQFEQLGATVEANTQSNYGNQLIVRYGVGEEQILVLGHFDTVKPIGTLIADEPWRIADGKVYGPGIFDMKAGIVFAYFALKAIVENELALHKQLVFLWNTDEETGSHSSRNLIKSLAANSSAVLVLEPAAGGKLKTSRKSGGEFILKAYGKAAHAGNDHATGINAIHELAHHILTIESWTNYETGTTLAVDVVRGGTASNVIAEYAEAKIDVRVSQLTEAAKVTKLMHALTAVLPGARLEVTGGIDKIPLERTEGTVRLFNIAKAAANSEGFTLEETGVGGTSDGNVAAETGIPVLDGLGAVGNGAHAVDEHIVLDSIAPRIAVLLRLLQTV